MLCGDALPRVAAIRHFFESYTGTSLLMYLILLLLLPQFFALDRPYIGILSQPCECDTKYPRPFPDRCSLIGGSAVKWLEAAGANVVALKYNMPEDELTALMSKINGVFFPGGDCPESVIDSPDTPYMSAVFKIFDMVKEFNDKGDFFPLWGTCQGFETLNLLVANLRPLSSVYTKNYTSQDISMKLDFFNTTQANSRLFSYASPEVFRNFQDYAISYNMHGWGISSDTYARIPALESFFHRITHNVDSKDTEFVSTIEARDYPIYGTQWHAEAVMFLEGIGSHLCHTERCVNSCQFVGNFFVHEARKSPHSFKTPADGMAAVIDPMCMRWFGAGGEYWETQEYVFEGESPEAARINLTVGAFVAIVVATVVVVALLVSFLTCIVSCLISVACVRKHGDGWSLLSPENYRVNGKH